MKTGSKKEYTQTGLQRRVTAITKILEKPLHFSSTSTHQDFLMGMIPLGELLAYGNNEIITAEELLEDAIADVASDSDIPMQPDAVTFAVAQKMNQAFAQFLKGALQEEAELHVARDGYQMVSEVATSLGALLSPDEVARHESAGFADGVARNIRQQLINRGVISKQ